MDSNGDDVDVNDSDSEPELESEDESESDEEFEEIEYKDKTYILDGLDVYVKTSDGTKGKLYGQWLNGKVKKNKSSNKTIQPEIEI